MGSANEVLLQEILKKHNYSLTRGRKFVFELLHDKEPQTTRELTERLSGIIDRASLYRTIKLFEELRIIQRLYIGWKYKLELSDIFSHHHHHFSCLGCAKVSAIGEDRKVERLIQSLAAKNGVTAERHQLEIQGYCNNCVQNKSRASQNQ